MMATATKRRKKEFTPEEKEAWKKEQQSQQKQMLEDALSKLQSSEAWENWVKFGRSNLRRLSFNNALLIWAQRRDATIVWGKGQWLKQGVNVNPEAKKIFYLAPMFFPLRQNGQVVIGPDGKPEKRVFFRTVYGYDITDTDAEIAESPHVPLEGDDHIEKLDALEHFAHELGFFVKYLSDTGSAQGFVNFKNHDIIINKNLSGNETVRTLVHELAHAYGNVNYGEYSREDAEVIVESATVMALGMLGFDTSAASVPYIASWANDLKALEKYAKLVDELVNKLTKVMGL
jgi:hypothetical protein